VSNVLFTYRERTSVEGWETALYEAAHEAYQQRAIGSIYLKDIVDHADALNTQLVMNGNTVIWHAPPSEHVRKNTLAFLKVDAPFTFHQRPIKHAFVIGAQTEEGYRRFLKTLVDFTTEAYADGRLYDKPRMERWFEKRLTKA